MAIELNGTTGITTPDVNSDGLTVDTTTLVVDEANNRVGIGTSSPTARLTVESGYSNQLVLQHTSNDASNKGATLNGAHYTNAEEPVLIASSWSTSTGNTCYYGGGWSSANGATELRFYTTANNTTVSGNERMRIDSIGKVLVNTTSDISASTIGTGAQFQSYVPNGQSSMAASFVAGGTGPWLVGFSSTTYSYKMYAGSSGPQLSNGSWVNSSDERLKTNITSIEGGLEKVMQLRAVGFNWIENNEYAYGFIAQEVQPVIPEIVTPPSPDGMLGLSYTELIPFLTKAIQEQQVTIQSLEARVAALEAA